MLCQQRLYGPIRGSSPPDPIRYALERRGNFRMGLTIFSRFAANAMANFSTFRSAGRVSLRPLFIVALAASAFGLGGCAQSPSTQRMAQSKEYFPSSIYGPASPRVVGE